ncbi:hypothetical protein HYH02_003749 [Chlamydomonas schloesseri]|uniref:BACK domain-containing protein n=1 Tax=Chlamydomonas schloesseri TaxID=2026947 RepID=A0A835WQD9_9CHLO|nr:hypothetical protein HYH02_003749 [Chlamydomonas schloesseri]|eukprot:KAG2451977.1 hypothetical protein HYH02_003749 [Chlamydomonas schloesseri]
MATKTIEQQQPSGNARVVGGIAGLFGQPDFADCQIVFILDHSPLYDQPQSESVAAASTGVEPEAPCSGHKRAREETLGEDASPAAGAQRARLACKPLPGHSIVLHFASDKIAAQLNWARGASHGSSGSPKRARKAVTVTITAIEDTDAAPAAGSRAQKQLPELEVSLGSEAELPAARAAIKFAYTGRVEAGSIREALQVRRQACYLQMEGCVQACLAVVKEKLVGTTAAPMAAAGLQAEAGAAAAAAGPAAQAGARAATDTASGKDGTEAPLVLEFFSCSGLWPDPTEDAAFAALLTEAKRQLVAHFGDALAVLNQKQLYEQMRALPAEGLEALLESDDFGTDSESSVVLLLVEWMDANYGRTDVATRKRLCGLLRLVQCSRAYQSWVLPALAATHTAGPPGPDSWFPLTVADMARLSTYVSASAAERRHMADGNWGPCAIVKRWPVGWLSSTPRRLCVPAQGRTFSFSASLQELEKALGSLEEGSDGTLEPAIENAPARGAYVHGLEWQAQLVVRNGSADVGCYMAVRLPSSLRRLGSAASQLMLTGLTAFPKRLNICVYGGAASGAAAAGAGDAPSQRRKAYHKRYGDHEFVRVGSGWGVPGAFQLRAAPAAAPPAQQQQQPQGGPGQGPQQQAGGAAGSVAGGSAVATQWVDYLQGGNRLAGAITLMPPSST